ncbi:TPA: hypothetical protein N0F65_008726 [Lagenidium giganteum]|uniref:Uncharacterized protein n=1 Tax=Lagenidium giganteum TaxID=4803 RepID=A0AAV2YSF1_9STRA|nr:TPA: hypothetical protein N0F65_008726 [Lagenidium giganteum]
MHLHITIAMVVILNTVLYIAERSLLGMHKRPRNTEEEIVDGESKAPFHGGLQAATLKEAEPSERHTGVRCGAASLMDAEGESEVDLSADSVSRRTSSSLLCCATSSSAIYITLPFH